MTTTPSTAPSGDDETWAKMAVERTMDWVDAEADKWAEEVNLTAMVKMMATIADLSPNGPANERRKLVDRWESNFDNWCKQVFLEAWLRSYDSYKAYRDKKEAALLSAQSAPDVAKAVAGYDEVDIRLLKEIGLDYMAALAKDLRGQKLQIAANSLEAAVRILKPIIEKDKPNG